jgi:heme-degrading monooxygenase HmoA
MYQALTDKPRIEMLVSHYETSPEVVMYARVQTVHLPAEKLEEMTAVAREQLPAARALPGFRGFYSLIDRDHAKALVISFWQTEEDLRRVDTDAVARERTAAEVGIDSRPSEIFEVVIQAS